jgi:hypothetical protein
MTSQWLNKSIPENLKFNSETGLIISLSVDQMIGKLISNLIGKVDKTTLI